VLSAPEPAPGQQEDRRERPSAIAAGCPSVLIVRPFVPAWRALRRCRARAGARAGPGRHPGHPTRRRVAIQRAGACRWNSWP